LKVEGAEVYILVAAEQGDDLPARARQRRQEPRRHAFPLADDAAQRRVVRLVAGQERRDTPCPMHSAASGGHDERMARRVMQQDQRTAAQNRPAAPDEATGE